MGYRLRTTGTLGLHFNLVHHRSKAACNTGGLSDGDSNFTCHGEEFIVGYAELALMPELLVSVSNMVQRLRERGDGSLGWQGKGPSQRPSAGEAFVRRPLRSHTSIQQNCYQITQPAY
jgi:hypothetical protein